MTYVEPHTLATGDQVEDREHKLVLILDGNSGRREYATNVAEAITYDNAYDHAASTCESPDSSDGCWYEEA